MQKVSIIIPVKEKNDIYLKECIEGIKKQNYLDYEILVVPDSACPGKPSKKRNWAVNQATGEILCFIDSDAVPCDENWLSNSIKFFDDQEIGAIAGPQLNHPTDSFFQKISGKTLALKICSGGFADRYKIGKKGLVEVSEMPSVNLFVRKRLFENFDELILTGEDAKLCFQIKKKGYKVIYNPSIQVYHHRRKNLWLHCKQIFIYGRDKVKVLKDLKIFKLSYYIPTLFVLGLCFGWLISQQIYFTILSIYLLIVILSSLKYRLWEAGFVMVYVILTPLSYGLGFLWGLIR